MKQLGFDNEMYSKIQKEKILERIEKFDGKLYLEFGGKLFDDYHASRILRGFKSDSKLQILLSMKEDVEIVIVINSNDIENNKIRNDTGYTYQGEVERLIDAYKESGLYVSSVVFSFYHDNPTVNKFKTRLEHYGIKTYKHYKIEGYPNDINTVLSDKGLGKNEYVITNKPLVIVTAPGPGSGKLATCLSQVYQDNIKGLKSGYAKFETFPVWNLDLNHPVNIAYEAATVDLNDSNMIDYFHLEHYGVKTVNYNRDLESFPLLKTIFEGIYGLSPYNSPTDMGVNMIGSGIINEEVVSEDCKQEIIRRYYTAKKNAYLGLYSEELADKELLLLSKLNGSINERRCVKPCLDKAKKENAPVTSIELEDGTVISGKRTDLLTSCSAMLINALKYLSNIDDKILLISKETVKEINALRGEYSKDYHYRLHASEVLLTLAIQRQTNPLAETALSKLSELKGAQVHSSALLGKSELDTLKRLGMDVSEEPVSFAGKLNIK